MKSNKGNSGGTTMDYQLSRNSFLSQNSFPTPSSLGFQLELFPLNESALEADRGATLAAGSNTRDEVPSNVTDPNGDKEGLKVPEKIDPSLHEALDVRYDIADGKGYNKEDFVSKYLKILNEKEGGFTSEEFLKLLRVELIPKKLYENEEFIVEKLGEIWGNSKRDLILDRYKGLNLSMNETRASKDGTPKTFDKFLNEYGNESIGYNQALGKWLKAQKSNNPYFSESQ